MQFIIQAGTPGIGLPKHSAIFFVNIIRGEMQMKNKVFSVILVLALAFSLSIPAFAAGFSDLNGHWAKEYMEDLANKGYLSGYKDGTMQPEKYISACETLALLSRFYSPDDEALELIEADFGEYVSDTVASTMSWAYDEIEICLAAGIIAKDELEETDLSEPIEKERLSVFLIRAMQLQAEAEALSGTELTFEDADDISEDCIGSVAKLVSLGVVVGNEKNDFSPTLGVVRGIVAAMVSRSLNFIKKEGITLTIEVYDGVVKAEGIITSAGSSSLTICGTDGLMRKYSVKSTSTVTVNGTARTLSSVYNGCYVSVTAKDGAVISADIVYDSDVQWIQGIVYSKFDSTSTRYLYMSNPESGDVTKYTLSSTATVTLNGSAIGFSSIIGGYFVTLKIEGDTVSELAATSTDFDITGTITSISYGTTVTMEVSDTAGTVYCFYLDISDLPAIYRGTTAITVDRLSVGDEITVTMEISVVSSIVTEGSEDTLTGVLISTTTTTSGTQWVVQAADGTSATYSIDVNAGVYSGNTSILLSDIQAGDTVTLVVYDSTAMEIYLVTSANTNTKVSGTVLAVNTTSRTITILTASSKLVYIDTSSVSYILNTDTGRSVSLSSVSEDSAIVAYGTYESSTNFIATSIVIES